MVRFIAKYWKGIPLLILVAATVGAGLLWLKAHNAQAMADPDKVRAKNGPMPVRTAFVEEKEIEEVIPGTAITHQSQTSTIIIGSSRGFNWTVSDIRLKKINVIDGQFVKKDEVLFEIDDSSFREIKIEREAAYQSSLTELAYIKEQIKYNQKIREAALAGAKSDLKFRTEDVARRKQEYNSYKKLEQTKGGATVFQVLDSLSHYIQAVFNLSVAERMVETTKDAVSVGPYKDKADLDKALSQVETTRIQVVLATHDLNRCLIHSPLEGFATNIQADSVNSYVPAGQTITQVFQLNPVLVFMDFPQERLDEVALGQEADIVLDSFPKDTFKGKVARIMPMVNPQTRVMTVEIQVDNPKYRIKAGISGLVRLKVKRKTRTLPSVAVIQEGAKSMVFCVKDGRAHVREIQTNLLAQTGEIEVKKGLEPGDEVVVFGNLNLKDNDAVNVDWRKWARRE